MTSNKVRKPRNPIIISQRQYPSTISQTIIIKHSASRLPDAQQHSRLLREELIALFLLGPRNRRKHTSRAGHCLDFWRPRNRIYPRGPRLARHRIHVAVKAVDTSAAQCVCAPSPRRHFCPRGPLFNQHPRPWGELFEKLARSRMKWPCVNICAACE